MSNVVLNNTDNVIFGDEARGFLKEGANKVIKAVSTTIGPKGRPVVIEYNTGRYVVTKDGVTAAKAVNAKKNRFTVLGSQMMKDVATKTNEMVGDGTSTATVIAGGLINAVSDDNDTNIVDVVKGIKNTSDEILRRIDKRTIKVRTDDDILNIATVSANNDEVIGKLIADTVKTIGRDGVIDIELSKNTDTFSEIISGMNLNKGYISNMFINNPAKREVILHNPLIFMINKKLKSAKEISVILERVAEANRSVLIVADEIEQDALNALIINKVQGGFDICAIQAPGYDSNRDELLLDLATYTGGSYLPRESSLGITDIGLKECGSAKKVIINGTHTIIEKGDSDKELLKGRVDEIKSRIKESKDKFIKEKLQERVASLTSGVAMIKVGGVTPTEAKERYDRVEDALNATKEAIKDGYIFGGGVTLFRISNEMHEACSYGDDNLDDRAIGELMMIKAIKAPMRAILDNAGLDIKTIEDALIKRPKATHNVDIDIFVDEKDSIIIDPANVTKKAIESATSIASLLLSINCVILE